MTSESGTDLDDGLRAAFARAAHDITPGPAPLAAVRREGRARRRRRAVVLAALAVLGVGTVTGLAAQLGASDASPAPGPSVAAPPTVTASATTPVAVPPPPVRIVRPGQRVDAGGGSAVWLTQDGKHWTGTDGYENFRSVVDGNVDTAAPGVSHQSEGDGKGVFHSGLYYGTRDAGRVELTAPGGHRTLATLLELPGRPGWGVWYVHLPQPQRESGDPGPQGGDDLDVTLYDRAGRRLVSLPGIPGS
ncbi:hypothetical protein ACFU3J_34100 [Streptomyces sp. NPDC057411]|uniref:hypothetical protein n=1 Tax=unclassified Streptomyces TaxID=2593676 RepID=UPI003643B68A